VPGGHPGSIGLRMDVSLAAVRMFVHVLAAAVWVGGQIALAGLVPVVRPLGPDATKAVARRFALLAWPAFAVLLFTGIWNAFSVHLADQSSSYQVKLGLKLLCFAASGLGAGLHSALPSRAAKAIGGAVGGLGAIAALFLAMTLRY
jgi:putative copper export protein